MSNTTIYASQSAIINRGNATYNDHTSTTCELDFPFDSAGKQNALFIGFEIPESVKYKEIYSASLYLYASYTTSNNVSDFEYISWKAIEHKETETGITGSRVAGAFDEYAGYKSLNFWYTPKGGGSPCYKSFTFERSDVNKCVKGLNNGFLIRKSSTTGNVFEGASLTAHTSRSSNKPYVVIDCSEENVKGMISGNPSSGYIPKNKACDFSFMYSNTGAYVIGDVAPTSITLYYRNSTSGSYTSINCGTNTTVTVPASAITGDTFQWYATATFNSGNTAQTDVYTISTVEELSTAEALSPKNTMIDGGSDNVFSWSHKIGTGTDQTGAVLQYSSNGSTWNTLKTVSGSDTQTTISKNTFTSGQYYWRVATKNSEGNIGNYSDPVSFVCVANPVVSYVNAESNPRPVITWTAAEQQAYEIKCDDWLSGVKFGNDNSFKLPYYLDDGYHVICVRVQNVYGLWSEFAEVSLNVSNVTGEPITITVSGDNDASVMINTAGSYDSFVIYRDGKAIASTKNTLYEDNLASGTHEYVVRGIYSDSSYYGLSNIVSSRIVPDCTLISLYEKIDWVRLELSTSMNYGCSVSDDWTYSTMHVTAADYPVPVKSKYRDKSISVQTAFKIDDNRYMMLESMSGEEVVLKTQYGDMVVGVLSSIRKNTNPFYRSYSFTVRQIWIDEEVQL